MSAVDITPETTTAYAVCITCGIGLPDREAMTAHARATMAPTGETGVTARSHSARVVNPTPEERARNLARGVVSQAVDRATESVFESLDDDIRRGRVTEELVTDALRDYPDFAVGWDEWRAEGAR